MITAIAVDDPQVGALLVLHDIHRCANIDNTFAIRSDLRVAGKFQPKDVACDKWYGIDATTETEQGCCKKSEKSIFAHTQFIPFYGVLLFMATGQGSSRCYCGRSLHRFWGNAFGRPLQVARRSIGGMGDVFLKKTGPISTTGPGLHETRYWLCVQLPFCLCL